MKRFLTAFFLITLLLFSGAQVVFAQTVTPTQNYDMPETNPDVPQNLSTYTQSALIDIMGAISCQLVGINPADPQGRCLGLDPKTGKLGYVDQGYGAIGFLTNTMAMTFNLPVHTSDYTNNLAANFGIAKKTYAQGIGFDSLSPLINIWQVFLNTVYLLFTIIFMLIGLGIIFRRNIDARSVMTIQNALPKIVVVLLLVTFSFAIAGFLIDIMYVVMYFMYELFSKIPGVQVTNLNPTSLQGSTPFHAVGSIGNWWHLVSGASSDLGGILGDIFNGTGTWGKVFAELIIGIITGILALVSGPVGLILGGVAGITTLFGGGDKIISMAGTFIAFIIITFALIAVLLRLWVQLIKAYVYILIDVIVAPFWIAGSLIPGSPLTAGGWFRHLLSYLAVFPAALLMFLLGNVFVQAFTVHHGNKMFVPPMVGGNLNPQHFGALIGIAVIFMTPEVINMTRSIFKAPNVGTYQNAIGGAFGTGYGIVKAPISKTKETLMAHNEQGPTNIGSEIVHKKITQPLRNKFLNGVGTVVTKATRGKVNAEKLGDKDKKYREELRAMRWPYSAIPNAQNRPEENNTQRSTESGETTSTQTEQTQGSGGRGAQSGSAQTGETENLHMDPYSHIGATGPSERDSAEKSHGTEPNTTTGRSALLKPGDPGFREELASARRPDGFPGTFPSTPLRRGRSVGDSETGPRITTSIPHGDAERGIASTSSASTPSKPKEREHES